MGGGGGGSSSSSSSTGRIWTKMKYSYSMANIKALKRGVLEKCSRHGPHFVRIKGADERNRQLLPLQL